MAYLQRNLLVGAAALFLSNSDSTQTGWDGGPALPTATSSQKMATALEGAAAWRNVGYTQDGLEVSYEPDFGEVEVDQVLDAAKLFKQAMTVTINSTLAEATLENLLVAWGQSSGTLVSTGSTNELGMAAGALGDEPVERALVAVGLAPRAADNSRRERVYHARRVLQVDASAHSVRRNEETVFPVSFRLLPDASGAYTGREYGVIIDRNIADNAT